MLKAMHMPQIFWAEAIRHAVYVLNRVSTKALKDSTPYEALKDTKPNMRHLRVCRCKAYAKLTKPHLKKLDDRSRLLVYLGTQPGSKAYRLFDPVTKDMVVSRDVKFKEDEGWDWKGYLDNINPSKPEWRDFIISENQTSSSRIIDEVSTQDSERNDEDSALSPIHNNTHDDISDDDEIEQPIDNPSTPLPYTYEPNSKDSTGYTSSIASSSRPLDHTPVRGNYKEAAQDKKWIEAMQIEIDSINKNKTWKLATLPDNQKAIGLKWVFKTKRDGNGNIIKHKACLVAKGYVQEHVIDYDEVFAPVARIETVRLIIALLAYHGWEVHHLDVKSTFLHGELKEEVYVTQPEEQEIYTRVRKYSMLLVGVYVDDLKVIGSSKEDLQKFKSQMEESNSSNLSSTMATTTVESINKLEGRKGKDCAKIIKKQSKPDNIEHEIERLHQKPDQRTFSAKVKSRKSTSQRSTSSRTYLAISSKLYLKEKVEIKWKG
nr:zinc finger, CCHC-type [Tanacetum cinerariifolium]